jgi:hypothetical protein
VTVWRDDLGHPVELPGPARRVVSLVPSLTEAVAMSAPGRLIGATDWCTHPPGLAVARVRGTKNPDRAKIIALAPDLVIANREENRKLDVTRLRDAGLAVWVTVIESVPEALASLRRLLTGPLAAGMPGWLAAADQAWAGPPPGAVRRVAVPIWRDPWMAVGARTFAGDVLVRLGLDNIFGAGPDRYPRVEAEAIRAAAPEVVLLPDEPYRFTADDGPEEFPAQRVSLIPGRLLTWYGPSLATARTDLLSAIDLVLSTCREQRRVTCAPAGRAGCLAGRGLAHAGTYDRGSGIQSGVGAPVPADQKCAGVFRGLATRVWARLHSATIAAKRRPMRASWPCAPWVWVFFMVPPRFPAISLPVTIESRPKTLPGASEEILILPAEGGLS